MLQNVNINENLIDSSEECFICFSSKNYSLFQELIEYAEYLGMKIPGDEKYLDIAREGFSFYFSLF